MAGSTITAVAQWVAAKTIAATDPPNDANWLEILQTHADRQEYLYGRSREVRVSLLSQLASSTDAEDACPINSAGLLVQVSATRYKYERLGAPGTNSGFAEFVIPGTPTLVAPRSATSGAQAVFVGGDSNAYVFTGDLSPSQEAMADLATTRDIIWSEYSSTYIAVGEDAAGNGTVEKSGDGTGWTEDTSASSSNNGYSRIASDSTGQYVLVGPQSGDDWAYSDDGGATWTKVTNAINSDTSFSLTGIGYHESSGRWLVTVSAHTGDDKVWWISDPTTGTWASITPPSNYEETTTVAGELAVFGEWVVVGIGSNSYGNTIMSSDGGATWTYALGVGETDAASALTKLGARGSRLFVGASTGAYIDS